MKNFINKTIVFTVLIISILLTSCSNPTDSDDHEHDIAEGFRLKLSGTTVIEQLPDEDPTGSFDLIAGEETALITVYFLNHDGDEFQPDEEEYSLDYTFDDEGIVEFEQHDEDGAWSFHLHAEAAGTTNMAIMMMHGGHSDFTSGKFQIQVSE